VLFEDFVIKVQEPPFVSDETTSQKTKRVPVTYIGRDSSLNSSSITRSRRGNIAEGTPSEQVDERLPQRGWLSRIAKPDGYIFDSIGGEGSFVYVVDYEIRTDHPVGNFFGFVGFFFKKKEIKLLTFHRLRYSLVRTCR
jgi:hypothetical protein